MEPAQAPEERLEDDIFFLSFGVGKSRRYHEKLWAYYVTLRDWMKILTAVTGSAAFGLVVANWSYAGWFAAIVALLATLDVVMAPDKKADLHASLCRQFIDLARQIEEMPRTEEEYRRASAQRLAIEKNEPPVKRLVDLMAQNDESRARGCPPDDQVPLNRWQRTLGYVFTFGMARLEDWDNKRPPAPAA